LQRHDDILNKHFQDSLQINKMQSAFVQFANYMGYFFMAIPSASWPGATATKAPS